MAEARKVDKAERLEIEARDLRAKQMYEVEGKILAALKGLPDDSVQRVLNAVSAANDLPLPFPERCRGR